MANGLFDAGRNAFLNGDIDWANDTIKVTLIDTDDWAATLSTDDNYDDVTAAARVATATLANTSDDGAGTADADNVTFSSVSGDECEALVIWKDTGVESTSTLIAYFDSVTGLPVTPNGGDITVTWNASGIFTL